MLIPASPPATLFFLLLIPLIVERTIALLTSAPVDLPTWLALLQKRLVVFRWAWFLSLLDTVHGLNDIKFLFVFLIRCLFQVDHLRTDKVAQRQFWSRHVRCLHRFFTQIAFYTLICLGRVWFHLRCKSTWAYVCTVSRHTLDSSLLLATNLTFRTFSSRQLAPCPFLLISLNLLVDFLAGDLTFVKVGDPTTAQNVPLFTFCHELRLLLLVLLIELRQTRVRLISAIRHNPLLSHSACCL